jgi:ribose 5-phosphate isomerase RpiB
MENQRQKKKRPKKRTYRARGGILLCAEGASCVQAAQKVAGEVAGEVAAEVAAEARSSNHDVQNLGAACANQQNIMQGRALDGR